MRTNRGSLRAIPETYFNRQVTFQLRIQSASPSLQQPAPAFFVSQPRDNGAILSVFVTPEVLTAPYRYGAAPQMDTSPAVSSFAIRIVGNNDLGKHTYYIWYYTFYSHSFRASLPTINAPCNVQTMGSIMRLPHLSQQTRPPPIFSHFLSHTTTQLVYIHAANWLC